MLSKLIKLVFSIVIALPVLFFDGLVVHATESVHKVFVIENGIVTDLDSQVTGVKYFFSGLNMTGYLFFMLFIAFLVVVSIAVVSVEILNTRRQMK